MNNIARTTKLVLSTAGAVVLVGCAGPVTQRVAVDANSRSQEEALQRRLAVKTQFDLESRLYRVGYGVLKGAASECGSKVRPALGFRALASQDVSGDNSALTVEALNLTPQRKVLAVYPKGAAEAAGLRVGDVIVSSSAGQPSANEGREGAAARMPAGRPVTIQFTRGGAPMTVTMVPDQVCDYPLKVTNGGEVNAYADGKMIYISRGMMRFAAEDRELAMVVGHELGHNTMGHIDKKMTNAAIGAVFDVLAAAYRVNTQSAFMNAGASAYSQAFESEADYVGMYYMALAGYDTVGAADFWRRMAAEHPGNIKANHAASHPATAERFLALDKVGGEVRTKMESGMDLTPNRTSDKAGTTPKK